MAKAKVETTRYNPANYIETAEDAALYLDAIAAEGGDAGDLLDAIGDIARAKGMTEIAKASGLNRESLYKALKAGANPSHESVRAVLDALGLRFAIVPKEAA